MMNVLELLALVLIAVGCAVAYLPLGLIAAGAGLLWLASARAGTE